MVTDDDKQQGGKSEVSQEHEFLAKRGSRARGCANSEELEWLEEGNDRKHAGERPGGQHQKMTGEHAQRTERYGLIGVGIDVHESDIRNEGRSGGADIPAPRDDGEDAPQSAAISSQPPRSLMHSSSRESLHSE